MISPAIFNAPSTYYQNFLSYTPSRGAQRTERITSKLDGLLLWKRTYFGIDWQERVVEVTALGGESTLYLTAGRTGGGGGIFPSRFWQINWSYPNMGGVGGRLYPTHAHPVFQTFRRLCLSTTLSVPYESEYIGNWWSIFFFLRKTNVLWYWLPEQNRS